MSGTPANRSRPPGHLIPTLYYGDVGVAIDGLGRAFGFEERFRYGPRGRLEGAQLAAGGGFVMLSRARKGQSPKWSDSAVLGPPRPGEHNMILSVHVEDVDAHYERARAGGARIIHRPTTYPFGERQYTAEDLAGYRWAFSQTVADIAPEQWGRHNTGALRGSDAPGQSDLLTSAILRSAPTSVGVLLLRKGALATAGACYAGNSRDRWSVG